MRARIGLAAAVVAAVLAAACGSTNSCPTAAAYPKSNQTPACGGAPSQVSIILQMCEACSHTSPTCQADLQAASSGSIFLDTRWEVCSDNSSCAAQACAAATCAFAVAPGSYTVQAITQSGTASFRLDVASGSASCSGTI